MILLTISIEFSSDYKRMLKVDFTNSTEGISIFSILFNDLNIFDELLLIEVFI
jgi:hypothetical protein